MEINDILSKLGLDLSNPEAKRGAMEAIDAILSSRSQADIGDLGGNVGGSETEVELDPDLIQPSIKQAPSSSGDDDDVEIEDEENILDQIKHKESEDPIETTNSNGNDEDSEEESNNDQPSQDNDETDDTQNKDSDTSKPDETENSDSAEDEENDITDDSSSEDNGEDPEEDNSEIDSDGDFEDSDENEDDEKDLGEDDFENDSSEADDVDFGDNDIDEFDDEEDSSEDDSDKDNSDDDEEFDFDEDDLIDDDLNDSAEDEEEKTKHNARKIKRERTLAVAKKALADAQANKVSPALIRELEKSIEALEALTEAINKSIKDISDEEFNLLINRVLDAIDSCGNSGLTYTSEEERKVRAQEIKTDLAKAETQNELSAEDVAKIRAETQAVKAREKEIAKFAPKDRGSFKGFQEFLNSLHKAIALQVNNEETRDDSWSAINRRYSGTGILQPGKKVQELPNKRIPIVDFYFDCSSSWNQNDIAIGKKAVAALADLESKGQIKVNLFYFADEVSTNYNEVAGGWTGAWNYIVKNVIATQANNVVIMTDRDMQSQGENGAGVRGYLSYTVPGYVWYLWKNGANAQRLPRDLKGRGGTQQFSFNANDV